MGKCRIITYLRAHELGCTAERAGRGAVPHVLLAETIIGDFDVAVQGQQDIVELQVTVNDTVLVEVLESQADLRGIESAFKSTLHHLSFNKM